MARSRNIKPNFFKNEFLAELSPHTRLLFIGLWTLADRDGRLEDRPKRIKAEVFPYDNIEIEELLEQLASTHDKFIHRYRVENIAYIQINNFVKHQNPHKNEASQNIPAPPLEPFKNKGDEENQVITGVLAERYTSNPADSLLPITDSLIPITDSCSSNNDDEPKENIGLFYEKNMGNIITQLQLEKLDGYIEILGIDIVKYGIEQAADYNKRSFKYIETILQSWVSNGYKTKQEILDADTKRKEKNEKNKSTPKAPNKFHNYTQRVYDTDNIEKKALENRLKNTKEKQ